MAMIAGSIVVLLLVGVEGLRDIRRAQSVLSDQAVPALVQVEVFSERLRDIDRAFDKMLAAETSSAHSEHTANISTLFSELEVLTKVNPELRDIIGWLRITTLDVADSAEEIIKTRDRVEMLGGNVLTLNDELLKDIDGIIITTGARVETLILAGRTDQERNDLSLGIQRLNALTRVTSLVQSSSDLIQALQRTTEIAAFNEIKERLTFNYGTIIRQMFQLPNSESRADLARMISDARESLIGDNAMIVAQESYIRSFNDLQAKLQAHRQVLDMTSVAINTGIANANADMLSTTQTVEATVGSTISKFELTGVFAFMVVALVAFLLVELRIVRRLKRLSTSVNAIAGGNNEHQIAVEGSDELGEMAGALETFKDNSRELRRSNSELARFAYAASHDLRSPLRAIHDLAHWTLDDFGENLPQEGRDNLQMLLARADRLSGLLGELLDYSRAGHEKSSIGHVDVRALCEDVVNLLGKNKEFSVRFSGTLQVFDTYEPPLRQVFMNLIGNSIKHHDGAAGLISVDSRLVEGRARITVTDDGPGIPPKYHDRIFGLFETLKSRDDVEGSGMGLAIVRKLVDRYGGKVAISSDPQTRRGSTFQFDWPLKAQGSQKVLAA